MDADVLAKIREEFISSDVSLRELARRYGLHNHQPIGRVAKREDWMTQRQQFRANVLTRTAEKTADKIARASERILDKVLEMIDGKLTPQELKYMADTTKTVRDLQASDASVLPEGAGVIIMPAKLKKQSPPEDEDE